jgi:F-type H+-transporting ATPase subunit a
MREILSKRLLLVTALLIVSGSALAADGFTWLGYVAHATHIPSHIVTFLFIALVLILIGFTYRLKLKSVQNIVIPESNINLRSLTEAYGQFIYNQCKAVLGEVEAPKYFSFISTIFIVILLSNLIGLIPGFLPPTEYISTTLALGCFTFVFYNIKGCKEQGVVNYLKHFAGPLWYMAFLVFPIEIISNFIRPISLALRLRGNMYGDHLVLSTFSNLVAIGVPLPFYVLGILVSFIQAYVFTVLSMVYIALATHHDHGDDHGHAH